MNAQVRFVVQEMSNVINYITGYLKVEHLRTVEIVPGAGNIHITDQTCFSRVCCSRALYCAISLSDIAIHFTGYLRVVLSRLA